MLVLTSWGSSGIYAQSIVCVPRERALTNLKQEYGEFVIISGVTTAGWIFELFTNVATTSWTVAVTSPSNNTCAIAAGDGIRYHVPQYGREIHINADVY